MGVVDGYKPHSKSVECWKIKGEQMGGQAEGTGRHTDSSDGFTQHKS
jgi:hypothetical protein